MRILHSRFRGRHTSVSQSASRRSLEEVREGLGGNICRCGTYDGITKCALELAKGGA